ncbi:MAG: DUF4430 domain-containing protein [Solirubrobacterales bacterium]|nr:DUF4430 domain-containing protein [Solirubrobacterales bacterium]
MTNRFTKPAVGLLLGLITLLGFVSLPATASAGTPVHLRVVTHEGRILVDRNMSTGTATIKPTSSCPSLGGRTGPARTLDGATGMGLLYQASLRFKALRPLKVSDSDFGFGICGIGGVMAKGQEWWSIYLNNKAAATGAEGLKLKKGDSVLFFLSETWAEPNPNLLVLKGPGKVRRGATTSVRVFEYDSNGKRRPAAGAKVFVQGSGSVVTDSQGYAQVKISGKTRIVARKSGSIPSNRVYVKTGK